MIVPETLGFKAFADHLGCRPSYVTELKKSGRLVLTPDGKQVMVGPSLERIEATRNPAHAEVAARHAAQRGAPLTTAEPGDPTEPEDLDPSINSIGNIYQTAKAEKERYLALSAKRDYEISIGKLLDADEVRAAAAMAATALRTDLENLPNTIAPTLAAEPDEARVRLLLEEEIEHILANLAARFAAIAKE